jgi:hypothetical protein
MVANFLYLGGTTGDVKTGDYTLTGNFYAAGGQLTVGGPASASGAIRLRNDANGAITWRNGAGSADLSFYPDSGNRLTMMGLWQTGGTVASGTSLTSLNVNLNGSAYRIPLFA